MKSSKYDYESAVIFGAGPVGLWSAIQMLENNFAKNVVILEKRFSFEPKLNKWADREMVVQFHRSLLSIPSYDKPLEICPYGVSKQQNEQNRTKYIDLDHMSLGNIQRTLLEHLLKNYSERFLLLEMKGMALEDKVPVVDIGIGCRDTKLFNNNFNPEFILDATGYHSVFMNQMLGVKFEDTTEYGYALKITWPEHEVDTAGKDTEFHDCHENSPLFSKGYSSVAEFSAPIIEAKEFFNDCGYNFRESENSLPFLKDDTTPFSIKLPPFIRKIINSKDDHIVYGKAVALFQEIRKGNLHGINGYDFVKRLKEFNWKEADTIARAVRLTVNKNIAVEDPFIDLMSDEYNLKKVRVVFVPSRAERWLSNNEQHPKVNLKLLNSYGNKLELCCDVTACAVGDSLTSTDFRHGLGINRGIHTATRLFKDKINPELARIELVQNGYYKLNRVSDYEIFKRATSCRDWLISNNRTALAAKENAVLIEAASFSPVDQSSAPTDLEDTKPPSFTHDEAEKCADIGLELHELPPSPLMQPASPSAPSTGFGSGKHGFFSPSMYLNATLPATPIETKPRETISALRQST